MSGIKFGPGQIVATPGALITGELKRAIKVPDLSTVCKWERRLVISLFIFVVFVIILGVLRLVLGAAASVVNAVHPIDKVSWGNALVMLGFFSWLFMVGVIGWYSIGYLIGPYDAIGDDFLGRLIGVIIVGGLLTALGSCLLFLIFWIAASAFDL